jgi:polyisoprenoid-binding protein YceI
VSRGGALATVGLWLALGAAPAAPAGAQDGRTLIVDPAASHVGFSATSRFVSAEGRFHRFEGTIRIDDTGSGASGALTVDLASVDTDNRLRDDHLRSSDFLDVERHPTARFVTESVTPGEPRWTVTGRLTIRGVSRPVTLPVSVRRSDDGLRVSGELVISRREFGITYRSVLNPIRDEVRVRVDLLARPR